MIRNRISNSIKVHIEKVVWFANYRESVILHDPFLLHGLQRTSASEAVTRGTGVTRLFNV